MCLPSARTRFRDSRVLFEISCLSILLASEMRTLKLYFGYPHSLQVCSAHILPFRFGSIGAFLFLLRYL